MPDKNICSVFDLEAVKRWTMQLHEREKNGCHSGFIAAAEYCVEALKEAGFEQIELLEHNADGKNSAFDCAMPPAWELTGRSYLRIAGENTMLADTAQVPYAAAPWSAPTPAEGLTGEVIAVRPGEKADVSGKWVLLVIPDGKNPGGEYLEKLYRGGALGVAAMDLTGGRDYPDAVRWFNGTGRYGWYPVAGDVRLPLFALSGRAGNMLLKKLEQSKVVLHGVMNTAIYAGKIYTVTAVIPGKSAVEYALFSHMYEPFAADNSLGFGAACAIGKALKDTYGTLERTLRVVFGMELYGFAAFLADKKRCCRIAGALNMDAVNHRKQRLLKFVESPVTAPWFGDWVLPEIISSALPDTKFIRAAGTLSDDTFSGDELCGNVPVNWCMNPSGTAHHCGCGDFEPDWDWAAAELPAFANAVAAMVQFTPEQAEKFPVLAAAEFQQKISTVSKEKKKLLADTLHRYLTGKLESAEKYCGIELDKTALNNAYHHAANNCTGTTTSGLVPVRLKATPFSLADIPHEKRKSFRVDRLLYALFDGRRSLQEAADIVTFFTGKEFSEADLEAEISRLEYLEKYHYVALKKF